MNLQRIGVVEHRNVTNYALSYLGISMALYKDIAGPAIGSNSVSVTVRLSYRMLLFGIKRSFFGIGTRNEVPMGK